MTLTLRYTSYIISGGEMMKESFSPKDLCDITGVSLRTLHYYHEKGLLLPYQIGENGYRYYSVKDIAKLQYILFFKRVGFAIEEN